MRTMLAFIAAAAALSSAATAATPPKPYGAVPTARQVKWHEMELYAFVHFTTNTFTDKEWGFGDEKESVFNPTAFDADQITRTVKEAGLSGLIITAKHHDGFCIWPSKYTTHSVKNSPWKNGKGDVLKEVSEACKRQGIKFGVYLSPWDRNHAEYGRPAYVAYYKNQIRELLTNYGPVFEMWFDGANGGDGWYGGAKGTRKIPENYYDWKGVVSLIRQLQPDCAVWCAEWKDGKRFMFNDAIWGGSEQGHVPEVCWSTASTALGPKRGGTRGGDVWCPSEGDVSIRPGWFYHAGQDRQVKSPEKLMQIYFESVGRGANLILNIPPDRRGIVHENDVKALRGFRKLMDGTFGNDLAKGAAATASNIRGKDAKSFGPQNLTDGSRDSYWASDDAVATPDATLEFKAPVTFSIVRIREAIRLGQRVDDWAVDTWQDGEWKEFAKGTAIGACRLVRGGMVTTTKVRLRITKSPVCPAIAEFGLFLEAKPAGGGSAGETGATDSISKAKWKVLSTSFDATGKNGAGAIDGNPETMWQTHGDDGERPPPQEIVVDMGGTVNVKGFSCLPRQDGCPHGIVDKYEFYLGDDGRTWSKAAEGEFANIRANPILQTVALAMPKKARYFKFVATHVIEKNHVAVAELGIIADSVQTNKGAEK